jgi:hypothetical protein
MSIGRESGVIPNSLPRRRYEVLARQACDVWARPADVLALDHRNPRPFGCECPSQQFASLAAPKYDQVILFDLRHVRLLSWCPPISNAC